MMTPSLIPDPRAPRPRTDPVMRKILPLSVALLFLALLPSCQGPSPDQDAARESSEETQEASFWPAPQEGATPKVLLIGWDGIRVDVLREVPTPNLDALAAAGTFSDEAATATPTVSGPCWSSILIGVWSEKHGVVSNDFSSSRYDEYPDMFTRMEAVRPELNTFAAIDWLPLGTEDAGGPLISDAIDELFVVNGYDLGWLEADSVSVDATIQELRTGDPDALFVYLGAPDEISHVIGGIGQEYREAIAIADAHTGRLVEAIRSRPSFAQEDWLVLVVTDHGRTETGGHGGDSAEEATVFYLASGPSAVMGTPSAPPSTIDAPVTAMTHLGIEIDPAWGLDGEVVGIRR